jgi:quinol---cytochrome-c reductase cytochrome b subunit
MNRLGALAPAVKGFFVPIEKPAEAPVSPGMPPVTAEREEITSGH